MNPIIVIGMDNTGKTTLVSELKRVFEIYTENLKKLKVNTDLADSTVKLVKSPGPLSKQDMHIWCYDQIIKFGYPKKDLVIYDRFGCIDEQIYAPIVRKSTYLDHVKHLTQLIRELPLENRPLFIYARPSKDDILGFADGREQMEGVIENGEELLRAYDELYFNLHTAGHNTMVYNFNTDTVYDILGSYLQFHLLQKEGVNEYDVQLMMRTLDEFDTLSLDVIRELDIDDLREAQLDNRYHLAIFTQLFEALQAQGLTIPRDQERKLLADKLSVSRVGIVIEEQMRLKLK